MRLPKFSFGRLFAAAFVASAAALGAAVALPAVAGAAQARDGAAAKPPSCATSRLVVWLDTAGDGTAGGSYYHLELTNVSGHVCTLEGYPGLSAVDLSGHQLGSAASRDAVLKPSLITLSSDTSANSLPPSGSGATATVVLKITDVGVYAAHACGYVTAVGLRVYPPGETASKLVPFPFTGCSRTGPIYLTVEAVEKGILPK